MSSTLGIVRSRSRSQRDFEIFLHLPQYKLSTVIRYVCQTDNNVQDFNVDIILLYISAVDNGYVRKLKFSSYVHLSSINKIFNYRMSDFVKCMRGKYFRGWELHFRFGTY